MTIDIKMKSLKKESYFRQVQKELKQISWPSKEELRLSTKVVIASTFIFGMAIYITDVTIHSVFSLINNVARFIFG